jgi:hypothetical protein
MALADEQGHYESKFEFPLWKIIKKRAQEKDISYLQASIEVLPEYEKGIRYRDTAYEEEVIGKRLKEMAELVQRAQR